MKKDTVYQRILDRMEELKEHNALLRRDFADLGSYSQVGAALKQVCEEKKLVRVGVGIYGRTKVCQIEPFVGRVILSTGLTELAPQALTRLGYKIVPSQAVLDYNARISTQVPTGRRLRVQGKKTNRKIRYRDATITYEYIN